MAVEDAARKHCFRIRRRRLFSLFRGSASTSPLTVNHRSGKDSSLTRRRHVAPTDEPEHDERVNKQREITAWKHRLMDAYWAALPGERRASAAARHHRLTARCTYRALIYPVLACDGAALGVTLARLVLVGSYAPSWTHLCVLLAYALTLCFTVAMVEGFITVWWALSRSEIYDVLESEWTN